MDLFNRFDIAFSMSGSFRFRVVDIPLDNAPLPSDIDDQLRGLIIDLMHSEGIDVVNLDIVNIHKEVINDV